MRLNWLEIKNFRSFRDSGRIPFGRVTVVVGKNNVGKSALLRAATLSPPNDPHRGLADGRGTRWEGGAQVGFSLIGTGADVQRVLQKNDDFSIAPDGSGDESQPLRTIRAAPEVEVSTNTVIRDGQSAYLGVYPTLNQTGWINFFGGGRLRGYAGNSLGTEFGELLARDYREASIFRFDAERVPNQPWSIGESKLRTDCANVASVLDELSRASRLQSRKLREALHGFFPDVHHAGTTQNGGNVEVQIWRTAEEDDRRDLAVSLANCGSGVGQVLAILCALHTADRPYTFLIDEPSSFLHPGAVAELIELFRSHPRHQYIIATHSPEVVAAADADQLLLVRMAEGETRVEPAIKEDLNAQRRILNDVGARLGAVFGADEIMWVEGPTEERVLPIAMRRAFERVPRGLRVVAVSDTGAFGKKDIARTVEIYRRLCTGVAAVPPAVAFVFDREGKTEDDIEKLRTKVPGRLHFFSRRMIENYLLDPTAIASCLREVHGHGIDETSVAEWLEANRESYRSEARQGEENWIVDVHGAQLLAALFNALGGEGTNYEKVHDGEWIASWLLKHSAERLDALADEIRTVIRPPV